MRIAHVIPYLNPKRGGDVNFCSQLACQQAKNNHQVTILTTDFEMDSNFKISLESKGIKVVIIRCSASLGLFLISRSMSTWLRKNSNLIDVIHLHDFRSYQNVVSHRWAVKNRIPYVLQAHGSLLPLSQKIILKMLYDLLWKRKILADASFLIALSTYEASLYSSMKVGKERIVIVPNGAIVPAERDAPKRGSFRRKYGIGPDEMVVLYVGRLHRSKGVELLTNAFLDVSEHIRDARLVIIGPDFGDQPVIEKILRSSSFGSRAILTGFVSEEERAAAFIDSDVFVTPSYSGFPSTFLEACSYGVPIITTTKGDTLDWIDGKVGYVVDYSENCLRDAMQELLTDQNSREDFSRNGKEIVRTQFDWGIVASAVEVIYRESIERQSICGGK